MRVLAAIALAGCSYQPPVAAQPGDASDPSDGMTSDTPGGDASQSCVDQWLAGSVTLSTPVIVPNVSFGTTERDPWLNKDETFIYFSRPGSGGDTDVQFCERAQSGFFNSPQEKGSLSDNQAEDEKVAMTDDELTAVVASNRNGSFDLFEATRASAGITGFSNPSNLNLVAINTAGDEADPHLSGDGLRLYFAAGAPQKIFVAERAARIAAFDPAVAVANIDDASGDADPTLSGDERVIVFTSNRNAGAGTDLFFATRSDRNQPFGTPVAVPGINGTTNEGDPHLSPDGCHLYLVSNRAGGSDIYLSTVQ